MANQGISKILIILLPAIIALLVLVATLAIYYIFYKRSVNKALENKDASKRRMPPPYKVLIGASVVILFATSLFILYLVLTSSNDDICYKYADGEYNYSVYPPEKMTGYLSVYSIEGNEGYKKYTEEKGDIRFTYFISEQEYDTYHPAFLVYVEYIGEKEVLYTGYQGDFLRNTGELIGGRGAAGSDAEDYFVVVGNASVECIFELEAYYYDTQDKGEEMSDGAVASEKISIMVD